MKLQGLTRISPWFVVLVAAVLHAQPISAAPVTVRFDLAFAYGPFTFGAGEPVAHIEEDLATVPMPSSSLRVTYDGGAYRVVEARGTVELLSGPFQGQDGAVDLFGHPVTTYTYGAGTLFADLDLFEADTGLPLGSGTFTAPVGPLVAHITDDTPYPTGSVDALTVAPGVFDVALAHALGIHRETSGGSWTIYLDPDLTHVTPFTAASRRMIAFGYLDVKAVPEPALPILVSLAIGAAGVRRRARV